jgi:hypothetical protein
MQYFNEGGWLALLFSKRAVMQQKGHAPFVAAKNCRQPASLPRSVQPQSGQISTAAFLRMTGCAVTGFAGLDAGSCAGHLAEGGTVPS